MFSNAADISKSENVENTKSSLRPEALYIQLFTILQVRINGFSPSRGYVKEIIIQDLIRIIEKSYVESNMTTVPTSLSDQLRPRDLFLLKYVFLLAWRDYNDV